MAPNPTSAAARDSGGSAAGKHEVSAAVAAAKKEKRMAAAAAAMAPRMQSQVQKWAKMTAELGGGADVATGDGESGEDGGGATDASGRPRKKARLGTSSEGSKNRTKTAKLAKTSTLPFSKQLRAPHRRDRYVSFGIGAGLGRNSMGEKAAAVATATSSLPPTCLLCLVRFDSRQQLRDHEALSSRHRRQLRDGTARKTALHRYAKIAKNEAAATDAVESNGDDTLADRDRQDRQSGSGPKIDRPPVHIKRLPRRRGDLAPTYTSYAAPIRVPNSGDDSGATLYHACLLCGRRFRSRAMLRLHERESALHRARTRDPASVAAAVAAVNKAVEDADLQRKDPPKEGDVGPEKDEGNVPPTTTAPRLHIRPLLRMRPAAPSTAGTTTAQYRDRARERRLVHGDSTKGRSAGGKRPGKHEAGSAATSTATPSKGAALLGKMGWTAGQGLGAQGGGLTEAVALAAYRSGVGLGAQGGKLGDAADVAARRTESTYADFVQQTRDTARQRLMALEREEADAAAAAAATAAAEEAAAAAAAQDDEDAIFKEED
ncbi:hypothetical protein HMPREF1624_04749 [Sporothrix schenckii ATCC 58251]|uniref:G-patch domain-containing protein n=1 Tax=Sporothrix schenckii (strain ATCC 58251 / de Perez 2211183) TaxID=1391915 RepID=U7PXS8_SPOS1|nr:hypothetical protein HMPREF1624_04749 [Sporothrix schenckii ATCC 58251]